jgi:hypothetical protein
MAEAIWVVLEKTDFIPFIPVISRNYLCTDLGQGNGEFG